MRYHNKKKGKYNMELRNYNFKNPAYCYNECYYKDSVVFSTAQSQEYKELSDLDKDKFFWNSFYEECSLAIMVLITNKLKEADAYQPYSVEGLDVSVLMVGESLPYEIYPNVCEWVNGDEFSEISYNGLSIKEMEKRMDFPSFEEYQRDFPSLTRERYEQQKARCYLQLFCSMAIYAKYNMTDPTSTLYDATCIFRKIL